MKADLDGFCICGENDAALFAENSLMDPVIIVLKKNVRMLKLWANILNSTGFMKGNPLFIIDDEADAASLNTMVNRNQQSSINKYLDSIKNGASSSLYLQVTGTPQAIFLQTLASGWHPYFTYYFQPGDAYLGGDFFFPTSGKPNCISFLDNLKAPMREVVVRHLLVSAQIFISGGVVSIMLDLDVPEDELMTRLIKRGQESGRADDNEETIKKRLTVYHSQTAPLIDWYKKEGKYQHINGLGNLETITQDICKAVDAVK